MQPLMRSERGSVLVITLLAVTLMIILGIVLLQVVQQGMKLSTAGEGRIMAEALAQKGLDEALATVRAAVEAGNRQAGYRQKADWLETNIDRVLDTLPGTFPAADRRGSYTIEIERSEADLKSTPIGRSETVPDYPYVRKVTVTSTGSMNVVPVMRVTKRMTMYISSINPVMRYALSAGASEPDPSLPYGDPLRRALELNGAAYIVGDMFAHGDMSVSAEAAFKKEPGELGAVSSTLPALRGFYRATGDVIKPGAQLFSDGSLPLDDSRLAQTEPVDVAGTVAAVMAGHAAATSGLGEQPAEPLDDPEVVFGGAMEGWKHYEDVWVRIASDTEIAKPVSAPSADVLLADSLLELMPGSSLTVREGSLVVDFPNPDIAVADLRGTLALDPDRVLAIRGNAVIGDGFRQESGGLFVQGDLKIYGDVNLYGTVYVDGDVELRDIRSINQDCDSGAGGPEARCPPLIIAASGAIELGEYVHDGETAIRAFLYASQSMKLYGVYSKLRIVGGLHADEGLELNAVKGALLPVAGKTEADPVWERYAIPEQGGIDAAEARLSVRHDINLYELPPPGIPVTESFNVYVSDVEYLAD